VTIHQKIGKGGAGGGVKQLLTRRNLSEHIGARQACACVSTASPAGREVVWLGSIRPSLMRVCFHSLRAILIGSMPLAFHLVADAMDPVG
jgi:hypothetical protein